MSTPASARRVKVPDRLRQFAEPSAQIRVIWHVWRGLLLMTATTVALLCLSVSPTLAQSCTYNKTSADMSDNGTARLQASTTQDNCAGRTARVEGRIRGTTGGATTFQCATGSVQGSYCIKEETDGEANATVQVIKNTCGPWTGVSNHTMWFPYVEVEMNRETELDPGDCQSSCVDNCGGDPECECDCIGGTWDPAIGGGGTCTGGTPILISLDKKSAYKLTSAEDGVWFDLDGNGTPEQVSWTDTHSDVAFLALDRDGDGAITSGKELFGNHTFPNVANGFIALRMTAMATNGGVKRGSVRSDDPVYAQLLLWTDANHNGVSEPWEMRRASEVLSEIGLGYDPTRSKDMFGNLFLFRSWAHLRTAPGRNKPKTAKEDIDRTIAIWDVAFRIRR